MLMGDHRYETGYVSGTIELYPLVLLFLTTSFELTNSKRSA
jgi:hypothetical protein